MKKWLSCILCLCLALALWPGRARAAQYDESPLRVGLAYGVNAVPAAQFINFKESPAYGFDAGYYDQSRQFIPLFHTGERRVAVLKDKPLWVKQSTADSYDYVDVKPSSYDYSIGCYHLEADGAFDSLGAAEAAAAQAGARGPRAFPAYISGAYRLRIGEYLTQDAAREALSGVAEATGLGLSVVGGSQTCYTLTLLGSDVILFEFDLGGQALAVAPQATDTWFRGYRYMGGFDLSRPNGNDITVVNVIAMNDYIKGVIPYEMSPTWPLEALKAQAVAAKCYAVNCMQQKKHRSLGFDLCNTTDCQVYYGMNRASDTSNRAVDETYGVYATYAGQVIQAYYHASSGGYTEDVENIWGNYVPYLRAVEDVYLTDVRPFSFTLSLSDIARILQAKNKTSKAITDLYVSRYSAVGNVLELSAVEAGGNVLRFKNDEARTILNSSLTESGARVQSHRYTVGGSAGFYVNGARVSRNIQSTYALQGDGRARQVGLSGESLRVITKNGVENLEQESGKGSYSISGTGSGHNIGMSQCGAQAMAERGFSYDQILKFYYTGIEVGFIQ